MYYNHINFYYINYNFYIKYFAENPQNNPCLYLTTYRT